MLGDLVLFELLQGAADDRHASSLEQALRAFALVSLVGDALAALAARHARAPRSHGVTLRKAIDLVIGTWCIASDVALPHNDRDFDPLVRHLGLRVVAC